MTFAAALLYLYRDRLVVREYKEKGIFEAVLPLEQGKAYSTALAFVERALEHDHDFNEMYYVLESINGAVYVDGKRNDVETGAMLFIPRGARHYAENVTLLVHCTPGYDERLVHY
jgi:mannose-6-phosphate isomerase-like protein (cupin superfamily)